jgi:PAS domain S-box-containing protein
MFRILQRDPAEGAVAYADHAEIYPPEDLARLRKHVEAALDRGEPYELELHAIRPSGEVRICLDRGFPEMGADGKVNRLFGTLQDITQRKQAEASLLASEERLRLALEATSDGLWDWNVTTGEVYYSPTYTRMLGYELREFAAQISSWADLIFPEDRARVLAINEACIQGLHDHFEVEFRMKARDGATRWIRGRGKAISRDPQGRALRILGTHQDVTEKRVAEELLRASEERFRHISSSMLDVAFSCLQQPGEAFAIDWMIGATESLFGRPIDEIKAARCWGNFVVEEDLPIFLKQVLGLAAGETGTCELRLRKKDGGLTWVQSYAQCLASPETPSSHRLLGALVDITERKQAAEENARLQAQLQQAQKMESLGTLAGGIAHDMNNVLGAILGLASANLEVQPAGTPAHRSFETIVKAATRGGEMVRSLLSFARQGRVETCELDLNAILREEVRLLERTTLSNVRLELDLEPGLRPMRGDAGALTHALMNLCVNAVDAMPDQGTLTLRTRNVDSAWIEVVVEDTGTGMSKEVREKAMEPFFTTKGVGKGTGLGLSMVYTTVQAHKGDMEILSEPGRGTSVRLRFPACEPETRVGSPGSDLPTEPPSGALKVLLVDDDELIQSSIQALLEALGHAAFMVPSGEAALTAVEEGFRPDVVILDMNMPGLGGKGTLPRLRTLLPQVPVLLSTGRADQAALELAEAHPHVTLMPKPFALKELQARLEPFRRGR